MSNKITLDNIQPGKVGIFTNKMDNLSREIDDRSDKEHISAFEITPEEVATRRLPQNEFEKLIKRCYGEDIEHTEDTFENSDDKFPQDIQKKQPEANTYTDNNYKNAQHTFNQQCFSPDYSNSYGYNQYGNNGYKRRNRLGALEIAMHLAETEHIYNFNKALYIYDDSKGHYVYADSDAVIALARESLPISELKYLKHHEFMGVYHYLFSDKSIVVNNLEPQNGIVAFKNGTFNIRKGKKINDPSSVFCLCKIDAIYGRYTKTPCFDSFIEDICMGDKEIKKLIWYFMGYCLIPDMGGKCFFVLGTAPNTGKSLLATFLENLVGSDLVSNISPYNFNEQFALGSIVGKSLNTSMDLSGGKLSKKSVEILKLLTGKDKININEKYEKRISYTNRAKLVFGTNVPIYVGKDVDGFWERLIIIPFLNSIPQEDRDPYLYDKIWAERDGIVNKAMDYAKKLIDREYKFPPCRVSNAMKAHWMHSEDYDVQSFVENCCDLNNKFAETRTIDLYGAYLKFCESNYDQPKTKNVFSSTLRDLYGLKPLRKVGNKGQHRGYQGIRLKPQGGDTP